jgi:hypothetical protein
MQKTIFFASVYNPRITAWMDNPFGFPAAIKYKAKFIFSRSWPGRKNFT